MTHTPAAITFLITTQDGDLIVEWSRTRETENTELLAVFLSLAEKIAQDRGADKTTANGLAVATAAFLIQQVHAHTDDNDDEEEQEQEQ